MAKIDNHELECQNVEELHGIDIDFTLTFENHIKKICKKVNQELHAILESLEKRRATIKVFITSNSD